MRRQRSARTPKARTGGLVVKKLADELLVYDLRTHKAHCLNPASALVWSRCDGRRTVSEIAALLSDEEEGLFTEEVIWLALNQLERFSLLEEKLDASPASTLLSRRELAKKMGLASVAALPFILSILAPEAAAAATCFPLGSGCNTNVQCCSGLCIGGTCVCMGKDSPCTVDANCCSGRCGSALNKCLP